MFEVVIETKELIRALNFANLIVEKRNVVDALGYIELSTGSNGLDFSVTDMNIALNQTVACQVKQEGNVAVSIRTLFEIVRKIYEAEITLKYSEKKLLILTDRSRFALPTVSSDSLYKIASLDNDSYNIDIPSTEMCKLLKHTVFAMSHDSTRYNLNGILLSFDKKQNDVTAVATDMHRLSISSISYSSDNAGNDIKLDKEQNKNDIIIPKKTAEQLLKLLSDNHNIKYDVKCILGINNIQFVFNNITLISKLVNASFPDYAQVIPKDNNNILKVKVDLFAGAIERVATMTADKMRAIKLHINKNNIEISASDDTKGEGFETLLYNSSTDDKNFCTYDGDIIKIGFNPLYILDITNLFKNEIIVLEFKEYNSAMQIYSEKYGKTDLFIVMPLNVG